MKRDIKRGVADGFGALGGPIDPTLGNRQQRIVDIGNYLRNFPWTHVATLTFERPKHPQGAMREFKVFIRDLERRSQDKVDSAVVVENTLAGEAHIHALLNLHGGLALEDIGDAWEGNARKRGRPQLPIWPDRRQIVPDENSRLFYTELAEWKRRRPNQGRSTRISSHKRIPVRTWMRGRHKIELYDPEQGWAYYIMKNTVGDLALWDLDIPRSPAAAA